MRLRARRGEAGLSVDRLSSAGLMDFGLFGLDADQMTDLPQHTGELRALISLDGAADLAQAESAQRTPVLCGLADAAAHLRDPQPGHSLASLTGSGTPLAPAGGTS